MVADRFSVTSGFDIFARAGENFSLALVFCSWAWACELTGRTSCQFTGRASCRVMRAVVK